MITILSSYKHRINSAGVKKAEEGPGLPWAKSGADDIRHSLRSGDVPKLRGPSGLTLGVNRHYHHRSAHCCAYKVLTSTKFLPEWSQLVEIAAPKVYLGLLARLANSLFRANTALSAKSLCSRKEPPYASLIQ